MSLNLKITKDQFIELISDKKLKYKFFNLNEDQFNNIVEELEQLLWRNLIELLSDYKTFNLIIPLE